MAGRQRIGRGPDGALRTGVRDVLNALICFGSLRLIVR
jgi:hypothetical protein